MVRCVRMNKSLCISLFLVILLVGTGCAALSSLRKQDLFADAVYRDATQSIDVRVADLLSFMTIEEKIGQLALVEKNSVHNAEDITTYGIGALLSGGGGNPDPNTPQAWLDMVNIFQASAKKSRLGIPLLYGVDAVHGHANVPGATIFPHAIGLGAANDPDLIRRIGEITAREMAATGITWNFAPTLDIAEDTRWGRVYETFGTDPEKVSELGVAYIEGLHTPLANTPSVIGTAKHYVGTGSMAWGTSTNPDFSIDQGISFINETTLRTMHLPPFSNAIKAGVESVMVGHLVWDETELIANTYLITDVLKGELGFEGFIVSDWNGVSEIPGTEYQALVTAINAGVDMVMLPFDYHVFTDHMRIAVATGDISLARLDDAVTRILRVKFSSGLFDKENEDTIPPNSIGSIEHRAVAREAVRASLVLLKDTSATLPLQKDLSHIVVAGSSADNLGRQAGGWTVEWQGIDGNWIPGTTILSSIQQAVSEGTKVEYSLMGDFTDHENLADVGIAVVGEAPYAEGWGDSAHPTLSPEDLATIAKVQAASKKIVIIIVSGRPLDISEYAQGWDAIVAAWLPGSEGDGVADVLFGDYPFTGTLPLPWEL